MELHIEKINVSDNKFLVTKLHQQNGSEVKAGDLIYSIESSKASKDVTAPCDGFIFFANGVKEFEEYPANYLIAQIVDANENPFAKVLETTEVTEVTEETKEKVNVIATKEALSLAAKHGVDLSKIDAEYITKWDVLEYIKKLDAGCYGYNSTIKKVAIIGAGRGAVQVIDLIEHIDDKKAVCLYDDTVEKQGTFVMGVPVVAKVDFEKIYEDYKQGKFDYIINAVSVSNSFRKKCFETLVSMGIPYCNLIHPSVIVGHNVTMGVGNILFPMVHIGPDATIGNDNFFTAKASIEHHNILGDHISFGPCVMTSGSVTIGSCCHFGAGVFVEPWVEIGENSIIASGSVLTNNVEANKIVRHRQNLEVVDNRIK